MSEAAARVARNAATRAGAEAAGKVASLVLMAVLARMEGPVGLGTLVLALAWAELAVTVIDLGFDRYLMRRVARDRSGLDELFFNVLRLKAVRAVPVLGAVAVMAFVVYEGATRWTLLLLCGALLLDSVSYTLASVFTAIERMAPVAVVLLCQRLISAAVGAVALVAGLGVVGVGMAYLLASAVAVALGFTLLAREAGLPRRWCPAAPRRELRRQAVPFAAQEVLAVGITRVDALLLSALASSAVVGYYGAAYRLFEATLLVSNALVAAFAAMFAYLGREAARAAFGRAVKLMLVILTPCAVALAVLAAPLLRLAFGDGFGPAAGALRVLAPTAVVLGVALITLSLVVSRGDARASARSFAIALGVNLTLNLALIPPLGAEGAALAMLATESVLAILLLRRARGLVGGLPVAQVLGGPFAAGTAMAAVMLPLAGVPAVALALGGGTYLAVVAAVEFRLWPEDAIVFRNLLRRRVAQAR